MGSNLDDAYVLRWSEFQCNVTNSFQSLRVEEDFFDVTLACDEDNQVQAHKVILAASSGYFRGLLKRNPGPNPVLIMPSNVTFRELSHLLDFMYNGEVSIVQDEIESFMSLAEMLKIKGLVEEEKKQDKMAPPQPKMPKLPPGINVNVRRRVSSNSDFYYCSPSPQHAKKARIDKRGKAAASHASQNQMNNPPMPPPPMPPPPPPPPSHPTSSGTMAEEEDDGMINETREVGASSGSGCGGSGTASTGVGPDSSSEGLEDMSERYACSGDFNTPTG